MGEGFYKQQRGPLGGGNKFMTVCKARVVVCVLHGVCVQDKARYLMRFTGAAIAMVSCWRVLDCRLCHSWWLHAACTD
jgi:hypothetical protein